MPTTRLDTNPAQKMRTFTFGRELVPERDAFPGAKARLTGSGFRSGGAFRSVQGSNLRDLLRARRPCRFRTLRRLLRRTP